jgi:hypothetical protein
VARDTRSRAVTLSMVNSSPGSPVIPFLFSLVSCPGGGRFHTPRTNSPARDLFQAGGLPAVPRQFTSGMVTVFTGAVMTQLPRPLRARHHPLEPPPATGRAFAEALRSALTKMRPAVWLWAG